MRQFIRVSYPYWYGLVIQSNLLVGKATHAQSLCLEFTQSLSLARLLTLVLRGREVDGQRCTLEV